MLAETPSGAEGARILRRRNRAAEKKPAAAGATASLWISQRAADAGIAA